MGPSVYSAQVAVLEQKLVELSKKANLSKVPGFYVSKSERFASVNVFQGRICVGEYMLKLWREGKFDDADVEATLAHEVGHLMDLSHRSSSANFRNTLLASMWVVFGMFPLVFYIVEPSLATLLFSIVFALGWGFSLPIVIRRIDVKVELEADRNAALYLVEPKQLATALSKISHFRTPPLSLGLSAVFNSFISVITHPTFNERISYLNSLTGVYDAQSFEF